MGRDSTADLHSPPSLAGQTLGKLLLILAALAGAAFLAVRWAGRGEPPDPGAAAPAFALRDAEGRIHRLEDAAGRWLVLYFYPKDATPGCTAEACSLRDAFAGFRRRDVILLGVSLDDAASHASFAQRHALPFPLLSDRDGAVARAYGALWDFGLTRFAKRHTYLIDARGRIARVFDDVSPATHAADLLAEIDRFGLEAARTATNNSDIPLR